MKTTRKHFERFKIEFKRYVEMFGLEDWDVRFTHRADESCDSSVVFSSEGSKMVVVNLSKQIDADLLYCAKHEALELLFGDLINLQCEKQTELSEKARHEIIHRLEKIIT